MVEVHKVTSRHRTWKKSQRSNFTCMVSQRLIFDWGTSKRKTRRSKLRCGRYDTNKIRYDTSMSIDVILLQNIAQTASSARVISAPVIATVTDLFYRKLLTEWVQYNLSRYRQTFEGGDWPRRRHQWLLGFPHGVGTTWAAFEPSLPRLGKSFASFMNSAGGWDQGAPLTTKPFDDLAEEPPPVFSLPCSEWAPDADELWNWL